ncbi:MAG: hypothetical protein IPM20_06400 [Gammaproteobacteria bacterium]|nr:hypothetical protein [Gammaproteobacteria bacterium]
MKVCSSRPRIALILFIALICGLALHGPASAALSSISVTPVNPLISAGRIQPFTATGTFSDGSVRAMPGAPIATGTQHTCAIIADGTVKCWGGNFAGELGNGTTTSSETPVAVTDLDEVVSIAAGYEHTCAVLADGSVYCWGLNVVGQLGNGSTINSSTPVEVTGISDAVAVASGYERSCALISDGTVKCWGLGYLGAGSTASSSTPVTVSGISSAVAVATGYQLTSCAVLSNGTVWCWGGGGNGDLGNGTGSLSTTPVQVSGINNATAVTVGNYFACALLADKSAKCWGVNNQGQLGNGTTTTSSTPVQVSGLDTAISISAHMDHTCALLANGGIKCWGADYAGQLGDGTETNSSIPLEVDGIGNATAVSAGRYHSCAVLSDGSMWCWGGGGVSNLGQIGNCPASFTCDSDASGTPAMVYGMTTATAIGGGTSTTCAVLDDKSLQCWGDNVAGDLGNGLSTSSFKPVVTSGITTAVAVTGSSGEYFNCALLENGSVKCWGRNTYGNLGNGTTTSSNVPVSVSAIDGTTYAATAITGGQTHACALLTDKTVQCWGNNLRGQLGVATNYGISTPLTTPVTVTGLANVVSIAAGALHTCAAIGDGTVKCWGYNQRGQVGASTSFNSSTSGVSTPTTVSGINNAVAVAAGQSHTCALLADGSAKCWGYDSDGQLGDGTTITTFTPVSVSGLANAVAMTAGALHSCALLNDGSLKCWGDNEYGQLGDGGASDSGTPAAVLWIKTATAISAGSNHTCAVLSDASMRCWGYNNLGQLGTAVKVGGSGTPALANGMVQSALNALTWQSDDEPVGTINGYGAAFGLVRGHTLITAAVGDINANTTLFVGTFSIGGTISGLTGTVVLRNNGTDSLTRSANGNFTFPTELRDEDDYNVTVFTQPLGQTCVVSNGAGIINTADVTNIQVTCSDNPPVTYSVGGTVSGLSGTLVLKDNGTDSKTIFANGGFTFDSELAGGVAYSVTVDTQPDGQLCVVSNGSGTVGSADITIIQVTCSDIPDDDYTVGGTVSGLTGTVVLENNGGDTLSLTTNGNFTFGTVLADGATYDVTVSSQPAGQTCSVTNGSGTVSGGNVTGVQVTCKTKYTIGGTISGLTGTVVLRNNGGDSLSRSSNGGFTFATTMTAGSSYSVAVATQPTGQTCSVSNSGGTVGDANVTNISVTCAATNGSGSGSGKKKGGGGATTPLMLAILGLFAVFRRMRARPGF